MHIRFVSIDQTLTSDINAAADHTSETDGKHPLNDAARVALKNCDNDRFKHVIATDGGIVGYAQLDRRDDSLQIFVVPERRREQIATKLVDVLDDRYIPASAWAFGDLEPARFFAQSLGLRATRKLAVMKLIGDAPAPNDPPPGFRLDTFNSSDADDLVRVNAAAFADHPEQGKMTVEDFWATASQDWFSERDILVARDDHGRVQAFCWMKITPVNDVLTGEIYVIGVVPEAQSVGLGSTLLSHGLAHMRAAGCQDIILYVEADNSPVVDMYRKAGFDIINTDVSYAREKERLETMDVRDDGLPTKSADRYTDRELSWLAFDHRVLDQAKDALRVPLLERVNFLSIVSSNLDEFFMVRVAGLRRRIDAGVAVESPAGIMPNDLYEEILERTRTLVSEQARVFTEDIRPALAAEGIHIVNWSQLTEDEQDEMHDLFLDRVFPVLTPLAVDPSHPFPYISGLSLNLAVILRNPNTGQRQFARVKVPTVLDRFIRLEGNRFLSLEDLIAQHLDQVFTGMDIIQYTSFRVTRNEDVEVEEDDAENILFALEKELLRSRVGRPPVRLEVEDDIDDDLLRTLLEELDITEREVFRLPAPLDYTGLEHIRKVDREDLKYANFLPKTHPELAQGVDTSQPADIFKALRRKDVLVQHPYDSFATSVQRLIEQAAADPQVLAIKQTLYRTSGDSPIIDALIEAAQAGKQVLAVVEIKARFDEQANIKWARKLEKHGVHVVYGMVGLKTHCKLMLIIRDEKDGLRRYAHIGTGNYNPKTARGYEDMGLLTSNPIITSDVMRLFNHLSGMTQESQYRRLLVSPEGTRDGILNAISREIDHHKAGRPARIRIKVNSIIDERIIDALYVASNAGVPVDLWVRGICGVRPRVPGMSENIRVRSILGRFLEHSRLYWFENGGQPFVGIGSTDLMHRNLDRRVEAIVVITRDEHITQIGDLFDLAFDPGTVSWHLSDQDWTPVTTDENGNPLRDLQEHRIWQTTNRKF